MKTVRFSRVVETAGRPEVHTLWVAPEKDPAFRRARDAHRVMTLASTRGKTDAGIVGYDPEQKSSEFLIFPKSLQHFAGARVVGIKFDLVEQPKTAPAKLEFKAATGKKKTKAKPTPNVIPFEPKPAPPKAKPAAAPGPLVREVRAALKELEAGKSVAAYRRLQRALET